MFIYLISKQIYIYIYLNKYIYIYIYCCIHNDIYINIVYCIFILYIFTIYKCIKYIYILYRYILYGFCLRKVGIRHDTTGYFLSRLPQETSPSIEIPCVIFDAAIVGEIQFIEVSPPANNDQGLGEGLRFGMQFVSTC